MKTRYGFIGCGMMGQEHIRNLALIEETEVAAIYEPNSEMRSSIKKLLPQVPFYESIENLLSEAEVEAWVITSPNYCHAEQMLMIEAIQPRPILVEKPVCMSEDQIKIIHEFQRRYACPVWVAMEYRYMPPIQALINDVEQGNCVGEPVSLTIREHRFPFLKKVGDWNRFNQNTGGTLVEKCCHFFDLMRLILKSEPQRIYAMGGQNVNHLNERYNNRTPDILDNAMVCVDFENGKKAMLELCMFAEGSEYQEQITIVGNQGKIECFVPGPTRFWNSNWGKPPIPKLVYSPRKPNIHEKYFPVEKELLQAGDHNGATFFQHQKFLRVIKGLQKSELNLSDGIKSVQMGLTAQESVKTQQAIGILY